MLFRSIRWRLVASYVLLTLLAVGLVGVLTLSLVRQSVRQREIASLQANAEAVARQAERWLWPAPRPLELARLAQVTAFLGNARVRILDARQQVIADSGPRQQGGEMALVGSGEGLVQNGEATSSAPPFMLLGKPAWWGARNHGYITVWRIEGAWGSRLLFVDNEQGDPGEVAVPTPEVIQRSAHIVTVPVSNDLGVIGYVELSDSPDLGAAALATTRRAFVYAGLGTALIAAIVGLVVARGLTAPLNSLMAATTRMAAGDLSTRAPVHGEDEIGQLARQFNQMAAHLEASFAQLSAERDALRRFIADASHELRTPITALQNFLDLVQGPAAEDPAARSEFLSESQKQVSRLEWITQNLLDLSRLEAGLAVLDLARHDVRDITNAAASAFRPLAQEKGVELSLQLPADPYEVQCDRARLEIALSNLIDNALKFTPPGGRVEVGAEVDGAVARWWVQDNGPGIDPADQPHIFERFYRGKHARAEGSGLGLAIVHSIVQAHHGRVKVESAPGQGSRFVMELPLA
jgi:signal transduction histidine kinase